MKYRYKFLPAAITLGVLLILIFIGFIINNSEAFFGQAIQTKFRTVEPLTTELNAPISSLECADFSVPQGTSFADGKAFCQTTGYLSCIEKRSYSTTTYYSSIDGKCQDKTFSYFQIDLFTCTDEIQPLPQETNPPQCQQSPQTKNILAQQNPSAANQALIDKFKTQPTYLMEGRDKQVDYLLQQVVCCRVVQN